MNLVDRVKDKKRKKMRDVMKIERNDYFRCVLQISTSQFTLSNTIET